MKVNWDIDEEIEKYEKSLHSVRKSYDGGDIHEELDIANVRNHQLTIKGLCLISFQISMEV